jgi:hypothetical protein
MNMKSTSRDLPGVVHATPVKSFFVSMLTRDIKLDEAILDLLDNCVDGVIRSRRGRARAAKPYDGFWSKITFDEQSFRISDNCGGIPWGLHDYAFRMGRPDNHPADKPGSVGFYGIGMKRALFKMGLHSTICTKNGTDSYCVEIPRAWMSKEGDWDLPVKPIVWKQEEEGTDIVVGDLRPDILDRFGKDVQAFQSELDRMIATHYAFILDKGLKVTVNGNAVKPRPTNLVFYKNGTGAKPKGIRPFIYKTRTDDVEVFLAVGLTRPIPSEDEVLADQEEKRYSSIDAGWTIVCNDRAVVYCDRSELTGWGESGVPRYHTQFIAISGIVEFKSDDPSKLPTTTTKRGIDASSRLYLQVKNKMREGMRLFTDHTNKWKGRANEAKKLVDVGEHLSLESLKSEAEKLEFTATPRQALAGQQYKPYLPLPKHESTRRRHISYYKDVGDIRTVAAHLYANAHVDPSEVGERCFDLMLREADK